MTHSRRMTYTYEYPHYALTADIVVFTIREAALKILLIKRKEAPFKSRWALPGGFLQPSETLEECAQRELEEETGVSGFYLEQLETFSAVNRDPRERVITVAYFALVSSESLELNASTDAEDAAWMDVSDMPNIAFDHEGIVHRAIERLRAKFDYTTLAYQFLPKRFTMKELREVYEAVLDESIERRNFAKKMLQSGDLIETDEQRLEGAHRPATVYRLKRPKEVRTTK